MFPSWTKPLLGSPSGSMKLRLDWEAASQPIDEQTGAKIPKDPGSNLNTAKRASLGEWSRRS